MSAPLLLPTQAISPPKTRFGVLPTVSSSYMGMAVPPNTRRGLAKHAQGSSSIVNACYMQIAMPLSMQEASLDCTHSILPLYALCPLSAPPPQDKIDLSSPRTVLAERGCYLTCEPFTAEQQRIRPCGRYQ